MWDPIKVAHDKQCTVTNPSDSSLSYKSIRDQTGLLEFKCARAQRPAGACCRAGRRQLLLQQQRPQQAPGLAPSCRHYAAGTGCWPSPSFSGTVGECGSCRTTAGSPSTCTSSPDPYLTNYPSGAWGAQHGTARTA